MARTPTRAQRAVQVTFILKGHLKNVQISYLRAAALLAKVRDEKLYSALGHENLERYAAERLGLQRTSLYTYLQIHDWAREFHPGWLVRKPKGFIPQLTDAYALMWIDQRLAEEQLSAEMRQALDRLRAKALAGKLALSEFQKLRGEARGHAPTLRSLLASLRTSRERAAAVPRAPRELVSDLDRWIGRIDAMLRSTTQVASLSGLRGASRIAVA